MELECFFFYTYYIWAAAFVAHLVLNFMISLFFFLPLVRCFSCMYHGYLTSAFRF